MCTIKIEEHLGIEIKTICHGYIETIFPHENGLYGFAAQAAWKMTSIPTSCNQYIVEKDGKYQLALNSEKMYWIVEKMDNLFNKSDSSYIWISITDWNETRTGIIYDHTLLSSRPIMTPLSTERAKLTSVYFLSRSMTKHRRSTSHLTGADSCVFRSRSKEPLSGKGKSADFTSCYQKNAPEVEKR